MAITSTAAAPRLIGRSPRIAEIRSLIQRLAHRDAPVLLLGETGTGKEVVARALHSARGTGTFVPIDCSVLGNLLESELFGHSRGAFTGAVANKRGLLEAADGGTAFFDEVGELALDLQAKLLRVLQDREYRPLGSVERRRADFHVVAASNRDLAGEAARGAFRRDLYYRLNVVTIRMPALRERREDIPDLARHFLSLYGRGHVLSPSLEDALLKYEWPGNVRELENCIRRMVALNSGPVLDVPDLPSALAGWAAARGPEVMRAAATAAIGKLPAVPGGHVRPLEESAREAIVHALECTSGDRTRAARLLGIGRTTLYRKIKRYGIGT